MKPQSIVVLGGLLLAVVLRWATGGVDWFTSYRLSALFLFGVLALLIPKLCQQDAPLSRVQVLQVLLPLALIAVLVAYNAGWEVTGPARPLQLGLLFLLFAAYPVVHADPFDAAPRDLVYLAAGIAVVGAFFHYAFEWPPGVLLARYAVARAALFLSSLFVIPRYTSRDAFLWTVSGISSVLVGLGLLAYAVGEYSVLSLRVNLYSETFSLPLVPAETPFLQSVLVNPNGMGTWAFAGVCAAAFLAYQAYLREQWAGVAAGTVFALLSGVGLYLTHARASMLGAAAAITLYVAFVGFGREALPYAAALVVSGVTGLLAATHFGVLPIDTHGRFAIWGAGAQAVLDNPTLLGQKLDTGEVIAPYLEGTSFQGISLHNSYLALFVQTGLLGGIAYLVLTVGRVIDGIFLDRDADVMLLSLAFGYAITLFFSSTVLFWPTSVGVLTSLVFGYAIVDPPPAPELELSGRTDLV
jgi:hypothetical protein